MNVDENGSDSDHSYGSFHESFPTALSNQFQDTVSYHVYKLYESYGYRKCSMYGTKATLSIPFENLHKTRQIYVQYDSLIYPSAQQSIDYFNHMMFRDSVVLRDDRDKLPLLSNVPSQCTVGLALLVQSAETKSIRGRLEACSHMPPQLPTK